MSDRFAGGIMIVSIRRGINLNVQIRIEAFEEKLLGFMRPCGACEGEKSIIHKQLCIVLKQPKVKIGKRGKN
jgi:hypothetical protein